VNESTTVASPEWSQKALLAYAVAGSRARSYENFTSYAVVFTPSCQKRSSRRLKVMERPSGATSHERANRGTGSKFSS
jgi:hypothetical protein